MFYKLCLLAVVILLLVVVMMDFTSRIISGLEAGGWRLEAGGWRLECGIVTLRWPVLKRHSLNNA
ncbi:DUF3927 domain-containing protein [Escherichia albertii]|uniref:DUF3927 domain-containing protein n=1 Tax=Escherichia albertii TaxID=208962 RepID=UPI0017538C97|nr:DUF3927 domain-containing protein [Escherichia albertii]MCU7327210.1 DUF3927 domain-containing protein [Escherichia albertii]HAH3029436.1 DUF3927 domain-containing protein [Escherichia albertii]